MQRLIDANKLEHEINQFDYYDQVKDAPTVLTLPENPTNGDMYCRVFDVVEVDDRGDDTSILYVTIRMEGYKEMYQLPKTWWNAPYKAKIEPQESEEV